MIQFLLGLALFLAARPVLADEATWQVGVAVTTGSRGEILPCT